MIQPRVMRELDERAFYEYVKREFGVSPIMHKIFQMSSVIHEPSAYSPTSTN